MAPCESSHQRPLCHTGVAQVCVWKEVKSWQCQAGGNAVLQTPWGCELSHPHPWERGQSSAAHTEWEEDKSCGACEQSEGPESGMHSSICAKVLGQDRQRCNSHPRAACAGATDVILIYSQTLNINQIFLYSVINVNHNIKVYWAASKDSSVKSRRGKPLKKCQAVEKVNNFWRNVSGLLCFQRTQRSLCA